jgi:hypothetical protein
MAIPPPRKRFALDANILFDLAEAALAQIPVLITRHQHLLNIPNGALAAELNAADLFQIQTMHPRPLLKALAR